MGLLDKIFGNDDPGVTREPEFAGVQYPRDADELQSSVRGYLASAGGEAGGSDSPVRGIIAPYGDYEYAGPVMASAYGAIGEDAENVERVLLLASSARVPFRGLAVAGYGAWGIPGESIRVDIDALESAVSDGLVRSVEPAFEPAAALELQMPFIASALPDRPVVPVLVGDAQPEDVDALLEAYWDGSTLLVVAANLSEGHDQATAEEFDRETMTAVEELRADAIDRQSTTARLPLGGAIRAVAARDGAITSVDYATSADAAGGRRRVAGYGAFTLRFRSP